ncbi:transporter substrate-binding domain-containing protein [Phaeovibrio sulfidiphilus]|uniref:Transporter substrate-binding domain-containing protein n=1 Tax=Phaeovibrio sulfidiphilus TaxID=1220600 RepID=A0A8J6YVW8_9PROT|nr:transporter substrate-binding domain-containing protein [Phaeovibrio sulfidiphilus]MBE1236687.1 transporter substrate-binding domain-containing protein [Phaeovibrio sulfidiphilus]
MSSTWSLKLQRITALFGAALLVAALLSTVSPGVASPSSQKTEAASADPGPTLERIARRGRMIVAFEASPPFSFPDGTADSASGYSIEYAQLIAQAVRRRLNRPDLGVEFLGVTFQNRFPFLLQDLYDIQCASTTHNTEREPLVSFSNTIFIAGTRLLVPVTSPIRDFPDLSGKVVAVVAGSTSETLLEGRNRDMGLSATALPFVTPGDAFRALEDGLADAFFIDDPLLARERAHAKNPEQWQIVGEPLSSEAIACVLRKDDPVFKQLVDETIAEAQTSGLARRFYDTWFHAPAPPLGISLDLPISDRMLDLFNRPNDTPFE